MEIHPKPQGGGSFGVRCYVFSGFRRGGELQRLIAKAPRSLLNYRIVRRPPRRICCNPTIRFRNAIIVFSGLNSSVFAPMSQAQGLLRVAWFCCKMVGQNCSMTSKKFVSYIYPCAVIDCSRRRRKRRYPMRLKSSGSLYGRRWARLIRAGGRIDIVNPG
jgi:hypothetical protein